MRVTNKYGLPQPIVDAVSRDNYTRGVSNISTTQLISPPRQVALIEAHQSELEVDASDLIYSLFGHAIHKILEEKEQTATAEQRLYMAVQDWVVSGAMDRIAMLPWNDGTVAIQDYKTAKTMELVRGVKREREEQLNIYRVLAELNGYKVGKLQAIFVLRDWSKVQAANEAKRPRLGTMPSPSDYPESQVVVHDIDIWPIEEAYRFIAERVSLHREAQQAYAIAMQGTADPQVALPLCNDEERWSRPPVFAVMKDGGKRASKVADTEAEALDYIAAHPKDKYAVQPRAGESLRCLYYCDAAQVCEQFKAEVAGA